MEEKNDATTSDITIESITQTMNMFKEQDALRFAGYRLSGVEVIKDESLAGHKWTIHVSPKMYEEIEKQVPKLIEEQLRGFMDLKYQPPLGPLIVDDV